jgi:hypothetical protein
MLADKDIDGVIDAMRARIDTWYVASLPGPRGRGLPRWRRGSLHGAWPRRTSSLRTTSPTALRACASEAERR